MLTFRSTVPLTAALALQLIVAPTGAAAVPRIGLSWNQCEPVELVHPHLVGERVAHLFVFVDDLAGEVNGFDIQIRINPNIAFSTACGLDGTQVPPAWSFEPGGCQGPARFNAILGPSETGCPTLATSLSSVNQMVTRDSAFCTPASGGTSWIIVSLVAATFRPWMMPAATRTTLWRLDFDLGASCDFAATGGECCPDGGPMRLTATGTAWFKDGSNADLGGSGVTYSSDEVPSRSTSWGQLKASYR